jgi:hypothetical protein
VDGGEEEEGKEWEWESALLLCWVDIWVGLLGFVLKEGVAMGTLEVCGRVLGRMFLY